MNEYSSRLTYMMAILLSHHNCLSFFVPENDSTTSYGSETTVNNVVDSSLKLLSILLISRLAGTYDKNVEHDILSGLSPFLVQAFTTVEDALRIPIQENRDSANTNPQALQQQEQLIVFLTTARRALENEEYENFKETINHLLNNLGITPTSLDTELKTFSKVATQLDFNLTEGMDDKTNAITSVIRM